KWSCSACTENDSWNQRDIRQRESRGAFSRQILLLFSGREENQHFQLFLYIVEAVFGFGFDKDDGPRFYFCIFVPNLHSGAAAGHVVHLVFAMRLLRIGAIFCQDVESGAHGGDSQEFQIQFAFCSALASEVVELKEMLHENGGQWLVVSLIPLRREKRCRCID